MQVRKSPAFLLALTVQEGSSDLDRVVTVGSVWNCEVHLAALHDEIDELIRLDILHGIEGDGDEVGVLAFFEGTDLVLDADEFGGVDGGGDQAVFGAHAGFVHVDELEGVGAVGADADIGAEGDVDAGGVGARE